MRLLTVLFTIILTLIILSITIPISVGQCPTSMNLQSPILLNLERCSGKASPTSDCTGILRAKIRLADGSQLLFWGIPAPEAWATPKPGIVWTTVK
jgi:hypothetical protein